ncbi:MAG: ABC transporter substrate-binding protein [Bacteroidia bacterium]|nr:ABC transporter substrate-binding protein [Bacteroidia bacterium]
MGIIDLHNIRIISRILTVIIVYLLHNNLLAQTPDVPLKENPKAKEAVSVALKYFSQQEYHDAASFFETAAQQQPQHTLTTFALYMSGLSNFYRNDNLRALERFQLLLKNYPASKYAEDAAYHKGILMAERSESRDGGFYVLLNLAEKTKNEQLRNNAETYFNQCLYEKCTREYLEEYYNRVRSSYKGTVLTALCFKLIQEKQYKKVSELIGDYQKSGNQLTPELQKIQQVYVDSPSFNLEISKMRVAILLPFFSKIADTAMQVPGRTLMALELFEGIKLAIDNNKSPFIQEIDIQVFDTEKDSIKTLTAIHDLNQFKPDVIIGDIFNVPSRLISQYAENKKIVHIIPLSPADELIEQKKFTFLANPSFLTQGKTLAKYISTDLALKKVLIIDDGNKIAKSYIQPFSDQLLNSGTQFTTRTLSDEDKEFYQGVSGLVNEIKSDGYDAVFYPSSSEERVVSLLGGMSRDSVFLQVIGTQDWRRFESIEKEMLLKFNVLFCDYQYLQNDLIGYEYFKDSYLSAFKTLPGQYVGQGYDIMRFLMLAFPNKIEAGSFAQALQNLESFQGVHQNYYFKNSQDNQAVQILQFRDDVLTKVK